MNIHTPEINGSWHPIQGVMESVSKLFLSMGICVQCSLCVAITNDGVNKLLVLAASETQMSRFLQLWHQMNTDLT